MGPLYKRGQKGSLNPFYTFWVVIWVDPNIYIFWCFQIENKVANMYKISCLHPHPIMKNLLPHWQLPFLVFLLCHPHWLLVSLVGWLNSSSLIFTNSLIFSTKFKCCENTIKTCSPRSCTCSSVQGIFICEGWEALPIG